MEPKTKTLQQKLGFFDNDLKKPKHDEIMFWLDENILKIDLKCFEEYKNKGLTKELEEKKWERPIISESRYGYRSMIGFIDLYALISVKNNDEYISTRHICFEVKTEIKSVGELMRQLNVYREYMKAYYVIVCPDDSYKDFFLKQYIDFVKYVK